MAKKWSSYLKHPLSVGFILSVLVIFLVARYMPRYYTELTEKKVLTNNGQVYYFDLDNDGNSEKIDYYQYDKIFQPTLYLYNPEGKFKFLWNFMESPVKNTTVYAGDFNSDSIKEIFVFTQASDSLFLYILNSQNDKEYIVKKEFITSGDITKAKIIPIGLYNLNGSGDKEFLFACNQCTNSEPKRVYAYDISNRNVIASSALNVNIKLPIVVDDINFDNKPEIILSSSSLESNGNDFESQLIVLNSALEYLFPPVVFQGAPSQITASVVTVDNKKFLAALNSGKREENVYNTLMLFNTEGQKKQETLINSNSNLKIHQLTDQQHIYLFSKHKILKYNADLRKNKTYKSSKEETEFIGQIDLIGDDRKELVLKSKSGFIILFDDFRSRLKFKAPTNAGEVIMSVVRNNQKSNKLSLQVNNELFLFNFHKNESFFYSHVFYFLLFIVINALVFVLYKLRYVNFKKIFKIKSESDFLYEIEDNIEEKFIGLKSKIKELGKELHGDSYSKLIKEVDQTMKVVKTLSGSMSKQNKNLSLKDQLNNIIQKQNNAKNISLFIYPEYFNQTLKKEIHNTVSCFTNQCLKLISETVQNDHVDIQVVLHNDYINVLIEAENTAISNEQLNNTQAITQSVERGGGTVEIDYYSGTGTIISANIPLNRRNETTEKQNKRIKVIIAEDHDVSLFGLVSLFKTKDDIELVGTAKNGLEVLKMLEYKNTDLVITDISMPGMDGIELSEQLQKEYPNIKVIVFTMYLENWFVEQLITNGARGFVSKNSKVVELINAVRSVYDGDNYYCPQFKSKFGFKAEKNGNGKNLDSLTKSELQIIKYYADDQTKDQIATHMKMNTKTMDNFLANILLKLNAGDEEEIIRIAKKQKFI
ncbi:MAG: response regulator [Bacteroidetes bacterium]|nr:response regulator [Bacteroidota bacterium]